MKPALLVRGDADGLDGRIDLADAVFVLAYLFLRGPLPACLDAADVDDTGAVDISDAITLISWLFLGGTWPRFPGPSSAGVYPASFDCGPDPTPDSLGCRSFAPCR